jgi:ANTAR domain
VSESLASAFAQLVAARYTHARATVVIDHVVRLSASVVPGASAAAVAIFDDGHQISVACSDPELRVLHDYDGPELDVMARMIPLHGRKSGVGSWPEYAAALALAKIVDVIVCPTALDEKRVACLSVYSDKSHFSDQAQKITKILSEHTAGVITNALAFDRLEKINSELDAALKTREVISVAKGIIMQRERCDEPTAFRLLARTSQRLNRKVVDVARHLVALTETSANLLGESDA